MSITPGTNGIPYNHREIFLAAQNSVGAGLASFAGIDDAALEGHETFEQVKNDFDSLKLIQQNQELWDQLVQSQVVKELAEEEFTVEYVAKNAPGIAEGIYTNISDLVQYSELVNADKETIEWLLSLHLIHEAIWNDSALFSDLLINSQNWMDYWVNLSTFGNPVSKMNEDAVFKFALHSIDEQGNDPYTVFSIGARRDSFLKSNNRIQTDGIKTNFGVPTSHDGFIQDQGFSDNSGFATSPWSTDNWRDSAYTNWGAVYLLGQYNSLRECIGQGRLGLQDSTFSFEDVFNGVLYNNFWEFDWDYELYSYARAENDTDGAQVSNGNISTSGDLDFRANAQVRAVGHNSPYVDKAVSRAELRTHAIDVTNTNTVSVSFANNTFTQSVDSYQSVVTANSSVRVGVNGDVRTWSGGSVPSNTETWDVSSANTVSMRFDADADARAEYRTNRDAAANCRLTVTDVTFSDT